MCSSSAGSRSGLMAHFSETDLRRIPYSRSVEVIMSISGETAICDSYTDIEVQIVASCEVSNPFSEVYQYQSRLIESTGEVEILYDKVSHGLISTGKFNVSWMPLGTRRSATEDTPIRALLNSQSGLTGEPLVTLDSSSQLAARKLAILTKIESAKNEMLAATQFMEEKATAVASADQRLLYITSGFLLIFVTSILVAVFELCIQPGRSDKHPN